MEIFLLISRRIEMNRLWFGFSKMKILIIKVRINFCNMNKGIKQEQ